MNMDEANKAIRNGMIAAAISGGWTLLFIAIANYTQFSNQTLELISDPFNLLDVIVVFICIYGLHKKSRTAAIVLLSVFALGKVVMWLELQSVSSIGLSLVFIYFYAKAIQGTFAFHKLRKIDDPDYKPATKWVYFVAPVIFIISVFISLGMLSMVGVMPSTEIRSGEQLYETEVNTLLQNDIIEHNDNIVYFYSEGVWSVLEGGSVLTEDRVISYMQMEDETIEIYELYFADIAGVELIFQGDFINDSLYQVNAHQQNTWLQILLSTENGGDQLFIQKLQKSISSTQQPN